jgi:hypothetical protein
VCLGDVDGMAFYIQNVGANDMRLYPPNGSSTINGLAGGTHITLATATKDVAICFQANAGNWSCGVQPGKAT